MTKKRTYGELELNIKVSELLSELKKHGINLQEDKPYILLDKRQESLKIMVRILDGEFLKKRCSASRSLSIKKSLVCEQNENGNINLVCKDLKSKKKTILYELPFINLLKFRHWQKEQHNPPTDEDLRNKELKKLMADFKKLGLVYKVDYAAERFVAGWGANVGCVLYNYQLIFRF